MHPCIFKTHISAQMFSFSPLQHTTNCPLPITLPTSLPDAVSCPQLIFTRKTSGCARTFFSFRCDTGRIWNVLTVRTKTSWLLVYS